MLAIAVRAALAWLYTPDKSCDDLEATYAKLPSQFIEIAGLRVHLRDTGSKSAPALIFLHGFGSSLQTWDSWALDLETISGHPLRFTGLRAPTADFSSRRSISVLLALMDQLGMVQATIVGNSMAGRIAWTFAALTPDRTDKLVLVSPDGFASPGLATGRRTKRRS